MTTKSVPVNEISTIKDFQLAFFDSKTKTTFLLELPDLTLKGLPFVHVKDTDDLSDIPAKPGCYWIVTNAPITHCLNAGTKIPPPDEDDFTIVYNGVCSTSLRGRAQEHLCRTSGLYGEMSGLSVDLILQPPKAGKGSHAKCAWSKAKKKLPRLFIDDRWHKVDDKQVAIDTLFLTDEEREYMSRTENSFFKNGIHVADTKHQPFVWKFYYCVCDDGTMRSFIETQWRKLHGVPQLCSYISGR